MPCHSKAPPTVAAARGWAARVAAATALLVRFPCAAGRLLRQTVAESGLTAPLGPIAPKSYAVTKVRTIPHEGTPWTQGLEFDDDGHLVETSGDFPFGTGSYMRLVDPDTGMTLRRITDGLDRPIFIEGLSAMGGRWYASTYEDHVALEYDSDFNFVKKHPFPWQGWGLTHSPDRKTFLATNSSEYVLTLEPGSFNLLSMKPATCLGHRVPGLNELEMVDDFMGQGPALLGNVIQTRVVLVLDPLTAACTGAFHLQGLEPERPDEQQGNHVANGIAYNKQSGSFWVTGKNWDNMFEVTLSEDGNAAFDPREVSLAEDKHFVSGHEGSALDMLERHLMRNADA